MQAVEDQLGKAGLEDVSCRVYNAYKDSGSDLFEERLEENDLKLTVLDLPAAFVEGKVYTGTYSEIGEALVEHFETGGESVVQKSKSPSGEEEESPFYEAAEGAGEKDSLLVLFVTEDCEACQKVEEYFEQHPLEDPASLLTLPVMEDGNMALLRSLMKIYQVPDEEQQVPLLFSRKEYLSGEEGIIEGAEELIADEETVGSWEEILEKLED